ncbi:MAG: Bax inhibitor-1/YccA family protein [Anaerolineae bacterium]|nr:Bax inhibitor-1/YccA family protein [Anaerolineae bacterium]
MSFYPNSNAEARPLGLDLSAVMRQVYLWMALGLLVAFGVAYVVGNAALSTAVVDLSTGRTVLTATWLGPVMLVSLIAYFILAFALQPLIMRLQPTVSSMLYLLFTALFGIMISSIFLTYQQGTIATAFIATAGMFGAMSIVGYTTKVDLSRFGSILLMALIGLIVASVINIFLQLSALYWLINYAGVLIFAGMTAYDTQWIKTYANGVAMSGDRDASARIALVGAFHLFLDFMNLFLFILRIMGGSGGRGDRR